MGSVAPVPEVAYAGVVAASVSECVAPATPFVEKTVVVPQLADRHRNHRNLRNPAGLGRFLQLLWSTFNLLPGLHSHARTQNQAALRAAKAEVTRRKSARRGCALFRTSG